MVIPIVLKLQMPSYNDFGSKSWFTNYLLIKSIHLQKQKDPHFLDSFYIVIVAVHRLLNSENLMDMKEKAAEIHNYYLIYVTLCEWKHG